MVVLGSLNSVSLWFWGKDGLQESILRAEMGGMGFARIPIEFGDIQDVWGHFKKIRRARTGGHSAETKRDMVHDLSSFKKEI